MRAYAKNTDADFFVIDEQRLNVSPIHYEKYQLANFLDGYERVLFVDTDVVVHPNSPDLFDYAILIVPIAIFRNGADLLRSK